MSNKVEAPARERRHQGPDGPTGNTADLARQISGSATSGRPFAAQDFSPLAWWRTLPSYLLRDAEHLLLIDTLDTIYVMDRHDDFAAALRGDAAAAVGVAFSLLPIHGVTLTVDIAMTALLRCALGGDATATMVVANLLHCSELDHPFATKLSTLWCTRVASPSCDDTGRALQNSGLDKTIVVGSASYRAEAEA
ncbi:hypothetical protein ABIF65_007906 [Bradyrhizobium japonicum]|uniref:Uncharacterized protein n=1 Tax=Bradyrhizobium barranii subsp. barranii TaxID=2823807 RepID=A0A939M0E5_9BRAD|nr:MULTISPECIES: hypothetical protein [Bradyrhizobium]MBR1001299.1 hypothetical protein [Bradyrhizobium liaoningense]MBR1031182.1 hypothetical protein [Bradyrhizobium liaoningense]MBR1066193.1 hypothetical protein [Bradyrhizobium liaoningense]MCP1773589.1 hypothetical protein [Bradyrhizobium japonicum]MCP1863851.1 hypothetical protein [Bradyrhizobium japonicum]